MDIRESIVTIDAIGTQASIMEQVIHQKGHFLLTVKKNQPQSYEEIMKYFGEKSAEFKQMKKDAQYKPGYPEMKETYEEVYTWEKNRDR